MRHSSLATTQAAYNKYAELCRFQMRLIDCLVFVLTCAPTAPCPLCCAGGQ